MKTVIFKGWSCTLNFATYFENKRTAIQLFDTNDGSPVATASINLSEEVLEADEIAIKDYGENSGMVKALVDGGIISEPIRYVTSGYVEIPICKLLINIK